MYLERHELEQAEEIVAYRGGTLEGPPERSFPGIDGTLDENPVSLKQYTGTSPVGVLTRASQAESQARNAGYTGVELFIRARNVRASTLLDFVRQGPLMNIPQQGTISAINVDTADGWIRIPGGP